MAEYILDRYDYSYYPGLLVTRAVNIIFGVIEFLLAVRLILQLLSANPGSQFVASIYDITGRLMGPFFGAFPEMSLAGMTLDLSIILAMLAYAVINWLIVRLLAMVFVPVERIV